jgi:glutathione S-transferase
MPSHKIPSATERYRNKSHRVTGVLDSVLQKQEWLVGDNITYADLAFVPWQRAAPKYCGNDMYVKYTAVKAWMN